MTTPTTPAKKPRKTAVRNAAFDPTLLGQVVTSSEPVKRKSAAGTDNPFVPYVQELWNQWLSSGRKSAETKAVDVPTAQGKAVEFKLRQAATKVANGPAGLRIQSTDKAPNLAKGKVRVSFTVGNPKAPKKKASQ